MDRSALVLYGSETGNAQDMAEELGRMFQRLHFTSRVEELDAVDLSALLQHQLVIFVISTTGQGDMPHNSLLFWKKLLRRKLPPSCLSRLNYTCFGLGDSTYVKFNWAARKLIRRLEQLGAQTFFDGFEADEQFPDGVEGCFATWADNLRNHLSLQYPHPDGLEPLNDDDLLPPRWSLEPALREAVEANGSVVTPAPALSSPELPPPELLPVADSWDATLISNERLTPEKHWQDVRHVTLDILGRGTGDQPDTLHCDPGDCLTIYPKNFPSDVQRLINLMAWDDVADKPLNFAADPSILPRGLFPPPQPMNTIRGLLLHNVDITAIPRRSFFKSISYFSDDPDHKERLLEFTRTEYLDEYFNYATRSRRSIIEVLEEFTSVRVPPHRLLDVFPLIRGRDFSIANGGARLQPSSSQQGEAAPTTRVELVVALVKYRTILRKPRVGLCSRYLDALAPGAVLRVTRKPVLSPIHGPANAVRPLVAIATGTGVAPARALIHERLTHSSRSPMVLLFGNRNKDADYFFEDEWQRIADSQADLVVRTAFSRDQVEKIYVQDLIRQDATLLKGILSQNPIFTVCGGSTKMAEACKRAVLELFPQTEDDWERKALESMTWWQEIW